MQEDLLQFDADERILTVIRRSLVGLLPHFIVGGLAFLALLGLVYSVARYPDQLAKLGSSGWVILIGFAIFLLVELIIYVLAITYLGNRLIVTSESLVQRLQNTPFHHKTSQLRLTDIQDVTFAQNGIVAHFFNFGAINVETAGEQVNFVFKWARNPRDAVRIIIEAEEAFSDAARLPGSSPPLPPHPEAKG